MAFKPFEKSKSDKESPRFGKEGSKKEEATDKKQAKGAKPMPPWLAKKAPAMKAGGKVKC